MQRSLLDLNKKLDFLMVNLDTTSDEDIPKPTKKPTKQLTADQEREYANLTRQLDELSQVTAALYPLYHANNDSKVIKKCMDFVTDIRYPIMLKRNPLYDIKNNYTPQEFSLGMH